MQFSDMLVPLNWEILDSPVKNRKRPMVMLQAHFGDNATWRSEWALPVTPIMPCSFADDFFLRVYKLYIVIKFQTPSYNGFWDMNFYPVESWQTDGRTDGQTDRKQCIRAHCAICTGGLNKGFTPALLAVLPIFLNYLLSIPLDHLLQV